ncbi:beta-ketoacyl synthase N-terminal-like domain-containing protein [Gorillibacterium timonense]|uniref:beta-ketoacyl synthase N-terminal-like domain-containing protein n=1 Tax=Gorillibacterium timonense TaxID=1689269 RepID=UPI00071CFB57|nr:type I polyketide synthase [Gorillibacterium timonense]
MEALKAYILKQYAQDRIDRQTAKELLKHLERLKLEKQETDIAIIGMAARFPGIENPKDLWRTAVNGINRVGPMSARRVKDMQQLSGQTGRNYVKQGGFLDRIDEFDAESFGISDIEALHMDPYQRILLELSRECLGDAGLLAEDIKGTSTGVFIGRDHTNHSPYGDLLQEWTLHAESGNWSGVLASRISYTYDLKGPAIVSDTACSSALVSVYAACRDLRNGQCSMALAGGISLDFYPDNASLAMENYVESPDGILRPFGREATGTVWGEGAGLVLLKPLRTALRDGDNIQAVIKGIALNNDGQSNGIFAPNPEAQTEAIKRAWQEAGIDPEHIGYMEAHGTGTRLGDPIELKGITSSFRKHTNKRQFCAIGAIKANIGHSQAASGMASLIKAVMTIKEGILPPSINFNGPNQLISFCDSPVYLNDRVRKWEPDWKRIATVSNFGFTGTNCHMVLQEEEESSLPIEERRGPHLFTLSAYREEDLIEWIGRFAEEYRYGEHYDSDDICFTSNAGRAQLPYRLAFIFEQKREFIQQLKLYQDGVLADGVYAGSGDPISKGKERLARDHIGHFRETRGKEELTELAKLYVGGCHVDWMGLYQGMPTKRISLPLQKYRRKRYWPERLSSNDSHRANPISDQTRGETVMPADLWESTLHRIWLEVLGEEIGLTEISVLDDYLEIGGNSVLAVKIEVLMEREGMPMQSSDLYRYRTIRELANEWRSRS